MKIIPSTFFRRPPFNGEWAEIDPKWHRYFSYSVGSATIGEHETKAVQVTALCGYQYILLRVLGQSLRSLGWRKSVTRRDQCMRCRRAFEA